MAYRDMQGLNLPVYAWLLDTGGTSFTEFVRNGPVATNTTAVVNKFPPLVSGADSSLLLVNSNTVKVPNPTFNKNGSARCALEAWVFPTSLSSTPHTSKQQILSNLNEFDGLSCDSTMIYFTCRFGDSTSATLSFVYQRKMSMHVVGIKNYDSMSLWVNGEQVAQTSLTESQASSGLVDGDGFLYGGKTSDSNTNQTLCMNGAAIYSSISAARIAENYLSGISTLSQDQVLSRNRPSLSVDVDYANKSHLFNKTYDAQLLASTARLENVSYANGYISYSGITTSNMYLYMSETFNTSGSIYGAYLDWDGEDISVQTSTDGTTWSTVSKRTLSPSITNGTAPSQLTIFVRVVFNSTSSKLYSLSLMAIETDTVIAGGRSVTFSYPSVPLFDYEPIRMDDNNGVRLISSSFTIGADTSEVTPTYFTYEFLIKNEGSISLSGLPSTTTYYRNRTLLTAFGVQGPGIWGLLHVVLPTSYAGSFTLSGSCLVARVSMYEKQFTQADVDNAWYSYFGVPVASSIATGGISIPSASTSVATNRNDWSIVGA